MTIVEVRAGPLTRRSLEKKSRHDVIGKCLEFAQMCDQLRAKIKKRDEFLEYIWNMDCPYDCDSDGVIIETVTGLDRDGYPCPEPSPAPCPIHGYMKSEFGPFGDERE